MPAIMSEPGTLLTLTLAQPSISTTVAIQQKSSRRMCKNFLVKVYTHRIPIISFPYTSKRRATYDSLQTNDKSH